MTFYTTTCSAPVHLPAPGHEADLLSVDRATTTLGLLTTFNTVHYPELATTLNSIAPQLVTNTSISPVLIQSLTDMQMRAVLEGLEYLNHQFEYVEPGFPAVWGPGLIRSWLRRRCTAETITRQLSNPNDPDQLDPYISATLEDCEGFEYGTFTSVTEPLSRADNSNFSTLKAVNWDDIDIDLLRAEIVEFLVYNSPWNDRMAFFNDDDENTYTANHINNRWIYTAGGSDDDDWPGAQFYQVLLADRLGVFV